MLSSQRAIHRAASLTAPSRQPPLLATATTTHPKACILRKRLKTGLPASSDNLPELRIILHDTMLWVLCTGWGTWA